MSRLEQYFRVIKIIYIMSYVITALISIIVSGGVMYFVGSNNPYPAAKRKLIAKAKESVDKILNS